MQSDFRVGDSMLGRYLVEQVARGGMGVVYLCVDGETGGAVALKTIKPEYLRDGKAKAQFIGEMETWMRLGKHPHIVQAYHIEDVGGLPFLIMEMVPPTPVSVEGSLGPSLREHIEYLNRSGARLNAELLLRLGIHVCRGMRYAVERFDELGRPFAHLDLKPANILVTPDGIAKVTDFGIARTAHDAGVFGGSSHYASPEQMALGPCDVRSDVYSFGLILFEMITRRRYYEIASGLPRERKNGDWRDDMRNALGQDDADLAEGLIGIVNRCLGEKPEDRFPDFAGIETELSSLYAGLTGRAPAHAGIEEERAAETVNRGYSFNHLGHYGEALSIFEGILSTDPNIPQLWLNRGISQYGLGRSAEAGESFRRALAIDPGYGRAWFNLGNIQRDGGDARAAEESYRRALENERGLKEASLNLGLLLRDGGRLEEGISRFEEALRLDPEWTPAWYELGRALYETGEVVQAVQSLQITVMYDPEAVEAMMLLSTIYGETGDREKAAEWRERARRASESAPRRRSRLENDRSGA